MRLSFNSWVYCAFPAWLPLRSLDDVIARVADIGYDGIEIGGAAPHGFPDYLDHQRRREIVRQLERHQLQVSALCPALGGAPGYNPCSPEGAEREAHAIYMRALVQLASELACPSVIWLGGHRRYRQNPVEAWDLGVEALQECGSFAAENGVRLVVEPTPADSNVLEHAGDCLRLIEDAQVDAGVMLDTFHVFHRRDDVREALSAAGDRLEYVHIADTDRDAPGTHRDFGSVVAELDVLGYDGWLSLEIGFNRRDVDPDALARDGFVHMRKVLDAREPSAP